MLEALAVVMASLELVALALAIRRANGPEASRSLRRRRRGSWILGALVGFASVTVLWPGFDGFWYRGFPLPGSAFRVRGDVWTDYISNLVLPLLLADLVLMSCLPRALVEICGGRSGDPVPKEDGRRGSGAL